MPGTFCQNSKCWLSDYHVISDASSYASGSNRSRRIPRHTAITLHMSPQKENCRHFSRTDRSLTIHAMRTPPFTRRRSAHSSTPCLLVRHVRETVSCDQLRDAYAIRHVRETGPRAVPMLAQRCVQWTDTYKALEKTLCTTTHCIICHARLSG